MNQNNTAVNMSLYAKLYALLNCH